MRHFFHSKAKLATLSAACGAGGAGAGAAAAQHPLLGLTCGAEGRKQSKRIGGWSPSLSAPRRSLSLSAPSSLVGHRPPKFLRLRRSTHFGLACGAEGRKQSKQIGDYPLASSFKGGG